MRRFSLIYCWIFVVALIVFGVYLLVHWNTLGTPDPRLVGILSLAIGGYLIYGLHFKKRL